MITCDEMSITGAFLPSVIALLYNVVSLNICLPCVYHTDNLPCRRVIVGVFIGIKSNDFYPISPQLFLNDDLVNIISRHTIKTVENDDIYQSEFRNFES